MGVSITYGRSLLNLSGVPKKLSNLTEVFKQLAALELSATKQRYIKEVDPDFNKWPDPITLRRDGKPTQVRDAWEFFKENHYVPKGWRWWRRPDKILRDTGVLFNSIGSAYGYNYAIVGTNVSYGRNHQEGIGVKQRKFLGINKDTERNIDRVMKNYLKGILS